MFDTSFTYTSSAPLAPHVTREAAVPVLHDFDTIIRFNPNTRGSRRLSPPPSPDCNSVTISEPVRYEVEDSISFIPKKLWSGGVRYNAVFTPLEDGCNILIEAPGGFTSTNHWKIVKSTETSEEGDNSWYIEISSDAKCSRTFASIVKSFIKGSHVQQQKAFKEKVETNETRPGVMRRRSSWPLEQ